jgi:hypothetical protein
MQRCTPKDTSCPGSASPAISIPPPNPRIPCIPSRSRPRQHASRSGPPLREALLQRQGRRRGPRARRGGSGAYGPPGVLRGVPPGFRTPPVPSHPLRTPVQGSTRRAGGWRGWSGGGGGVVGGEIVPDPTETLLSRRAGEIPRPVQPLRHRLLCPVISVPVHQPDFVAENSNQNLFGYNQVVRSCVCPSLTSLGFQPWDPRKPDSVISLKQPLGSPTKNQEYRILLFI